MVLSIEEKRARRRKYWHANRAKNLETKKAYRKRNAEVISAAKASAWKKDIELNRARSRANYQLNPDAGRKATQRYYQRNAARILEKQRTARAEDPKRYASYRRRRWLKIKDNPETKLSNRLRVRIHRLLGGGKSTSVKIWDVLGYSIDDVRSHIEKQFKPGMSWNNIGKWHIDHILPVSSFSFKSVGDPEFRACWALSNLRPLWKRDNLSKGAKRLTLV